MKINLSDSEWMYIIVESHNNAFFSASFTIAGLLELTIQTKTFSSSDANIRK